MRRCCGLGGGPVNSVQRWAPPWRQVEAGFQTRRRPCHSGSSISLLTAVASRRARQTHDHTAAIGISGLGRLPARMAGHDPGLWICHWFRWFRRWLLTRSLVKRRSRDIERKWTARPGNGRLHMPARLGAQDDGDVVVRIARVTLATRRFSTPRPRPFDCPQHRNDPYLVVRFHAELGRPWRTPACT